MGIPDHFTIQFGKNFEQVVQQTESRFRKCAVVTTGCMGEAKTHNQDLPVTDEESTGERLQRTKLQEIDTQKRWNRPRKFKLATFDVPFDEILLAPTIMGGGRHVNAHQAAYARRLDKTFLEGLFGTNYVGTAGVTPAEIPASNIIANDFVSSGTAAASKITVDKLIRAKTILRNNESYGDDAMARGVGLWGCLTPDMEESLLFLANAATGNRLFSKDFLPPVLDANGQISSFLGINFIRSTQLLFDAADATIQYGGVWTSEAPLLDIWKEKNTRVSERADLEYATQFFSEYSFNTVRKEDKMVVKIAAKVA
jgi:hypothetical protein